MSVASPLISVDSWDVRGQRVSVLQNTATSQLGYSVADGPFQLIPPHLYTNIPRVCAIIRLFHDVIADNLNEGNIQASSFVPVFESNPFVRVENEERELDSLVVLFGRKDMQAQRVVDAKWGICHTAEGITESVAAQVDGATGQCLLNVLCRNKPVNPYMDGSKAIATLDADDRIQSVALEAWRAVSFYDPALALGEDRWAVTLISIPQSLSRGSRSECSAGHAMVAYEGIEDGYSFLKYVHLTTRGARAGFGRVEILDRPMESALKSPTWIRTRASLQAMIRAMCAREQIPFAVGATARCYSTGFISVIALVSVVLGGMIISTKIGCGVTPAIDNPVVKKVGEGVGSWWYAAYTKYDCIAWAKAALSRMGIRFDLPVHCMTPNAVVEHVRMHPQAIRLDDAVVAGENGAANEARDA